MDYTKIISSYHLLDIARMNLYDEIESYFSNELMPSDIPVIKSGNATWNGNVLYFNIPEVIPHTKLCTNKDWAKKQLWHWVGLINGAYSKLNNNINFNKAFCFINILTPLEVPWDIDNRCFSFIINGIKFTRVIKDDSFRYMEIYLAGETDRTNPRTEIYLTESDNIAPFIKSFFVK